MYIVYLYIFCLVSFCVFLKICKVWSFFIFVGNIVYLFFMVLFLFLFCLGINNVIQVRYEIVKWDLNIVYKQYFCKYIFYYVSIINYFSRLLIFEVDNN